MDYIQLESFIAIAQLSSFSKAATKLSITQSTISKQIQSLEKELNVLLFDRTCRVPTLSEYGRVFLPCALEQINLRDKSLEALEESKSVIQGTLEIPSSSVPTGYLLPDILREITSVYPRIQFHVVSLDSKEVVDQIDNGFFGVGFAGNKNGSPNLEFVEIYQDELVIIKHNKQRKPVETQMQIGELLEEKWVLREDGSGTKESFYQLLGSMRVKKDRLNAAAYVDDNTAIIQFVKSGLGVSIVSILSISEEIKRRQLQIIRLPEVRLLRSIYFVYNKKRHLSSKEEAFKNFMLNRVAGQANRR